MTTTYIYIDDDKLEAAKEKVQGFEQADLKVITNQHKGTWESQMSFIKENESILDGLLLDLRLDDFPNEKGERADFRGTSIAQEIRTRQKEGEFKAFPIVLFSGNDKLEKSLENSGEDLFDICIDKGKVDIKTFDKLTPRLIAIADSYKTLSNEKKISDILGIDESIIDERFVFALNNILDKPAHVINNFLINEFINKQGLLINESILAARLGVDIKASADWYKIVSSLSDTKYSGILSKGWSRWWMPLVDIWWKTVINASSYLQSTPASVRVRLITEKLQLKNIQVAQKIDKADSEEYWTVCKGYNTPLDPVDGLLIDGQENLYPWQDAEYVSIDAAIKRKNNQAWKRVAKLEEERLLDLEQQFKKVDSYEQREDWGSSKLSIYRIKKTGLCSDTKPISNALLELNSRKDPAGYWGYNLQKLVFNNLETPRGTMPSNIKSIQVVLNVEIHEKSLKNDEIYNPVLIDKKPGSEKNYNFSIEISGFSNRNKVLSHWHLDFDSDTKNEYIHPDFHLTFGGNAMKGEGDDENIVFGKVMLIPSPRLPYPPMDAILGIDFIIKNFVKKDLAASITNNSQYRTAVKLSQERLWRPYMLSTASHWCSFTGCKFKTDAGLTQKYQPFLEN